MKSGIILDATNDKNIADSMVSILENTVQPEVICILVNKNTSDKQLEISKAFLKSCCDSGNYSEEVTGEGTIFKKENNYNTIIIFKFNDKSVSELKNIALKYIRDDIDYIFTITSGIKYLNNYIEQMISKLEIDNTGCVYSDYIENNSIKHLSYFHSMLNHKIQIKEFGFNKNLSSEDIFSLDEFQVLSDFYNKSIVRHIAEPLFII